MPKRELQLKSDKPFEEYTTDDMRDVFMGFLSAGIIPTVLIKSCAMLVTAMALEFKSGCGDDDCGHDHQGDPFFNEIIAGILKHVSKDNSKPPIPQNFVKGVH